MLSLGIHKLTRVNLNTPINNKCVSSSCQSSHNFKIYSFSLGNGTHRAYDRYGLSFEDMLFTTKGYIKGHNNEHELSKKIETLRKNMDLCFKCKVNLLTT